MIGGGRDGTGSLAKLEASWLTLGLAPTTVELRPLDGLKVGVGDISMKTYRKPINRHF